MSVFSASFVPFGPGKLAPAGGLALPALSERIRRYKLGVADRYRVVAPANIARDIFDGPLWITPKIDGELWFIVKRGDEVALVAVDGRVMMDTPLTKALTKRWSGAPDLIVAGELYVHSDRGRPKVHQVLRAFTDPRLMSLMRFAAFDLLQDGDRSGLAMPWEDRIDRLRLLLADVEDAHAIERIEGQGPDAVTSRYQEWVATDRAEGLVVRDEYDILYKVKPKITIDAVIVAFGERRKGDARSVGELVVALRRDSGTLQIVGVVDKGLKEVERSAWYRKLIDAAVPSTHRLASGQGALCRFVRPEHVIEIGCADVRTHTRRGGQVQAQVLDYQPLSGYSTIGTMPLVELVDPTFVRHRKDKLPDHVHAGLEQVFSVRPFEGRRDIALPLELPKADILRRGVYTKTTSDRVSIRKYVAIKTNKDRIDPDHPPYAVHFTDFSPDRRDPLKTAVRVAADVEGIEAHIEAWIAKNIKRGWAPVDPASA